MSATPVQKPKRTALAPEVDDTNDQAMGHSEVVEDPESKPEPTAHGTAEDQEVSSSDDEFDDPPATVPEPTSKKRTHKKSTHKKSTIKSKSQTDVNQEMLPNNCIKEKAVLLETIATQSNALNKFQREMRHMHADEYRFRTFSEIEEAKVKNKIVSFALNNKEHWARDVFPVADADRKNITWDDMEIIFGRVHDAYKDLITWGPEELNGTQLKEALFIREAMVPKEICEEEKAACQTTVTGLENLLGVYRLMSRPKEYQFLTYKEAVNVSKRARTPQELAAVQIFVNWTAGRNIFEWTTELFPNTIEPFTWEEFRPKLDAKLPDTPLDVKVLVFSLIAKEVLQTSHDDCEAAKKVLQDQIDALKEEKKLMDKAKELVDTQLADCLKDKNIEIEKVHEVKMDLTAAKILLSDCERDLKTAQLAKTAANELATGMRNTYELHVQAAKDKLALEYNNAKNNNRDEERQAAQAYMDYLNGELQRCIQEYNKFFAQAKLDIEQADIDYSALQAEYKDLEFKCKETQDTTPKILAKAGQAAGVTITKSTRRDADYPGHHAWDVVNSFKNVPQTVTDPKLETTINRLTAEITKLTNDIVELKKPALVEILAEDDEEIIKLKARIAELEADVSVETVVDCKDEIATLNATIASLRRSGSTPLMASVIVEDTEEIKLLKTEVARLTTQLAECNAAPTFFAATPTAAAFDTAATAALQREVAELKAQNKLLNKRLKEVPSTTHDKVPALEQKVLALEQKVIEAQQAKTAADSQVKKLERDKTDQEIELRNALMACRYELMACREKKDVTTKEVVEGGVDVGKVVSTVPT